MVNPPLKLLNSPRPALPRGLILGVVPGGSLRTVEIQKSDDRNDALPFGTVQVHSRLLWRVSDEFSESREPHGLDSYGLVKLRIEPSLEERTECAILGFTFHEEDEFHSPIPMDSSSPVRYKRPSVYSRSQ